VHGKAKAEKKPPERCLWILFSRSSHEEDPNDTSPESLHRFFVVFYDKKIYSIRNPELEKSVKKSRRTKMTKNLTNQNKL
jgi:hypothetical protein